jgi:palmitoyltransferase
MVYLGVRIGILYQFTIVKVIGYFSAILALIFALFVLNLLLFHSYIISKNVTTWEQLSWKKISYLKDWDKRHGSPFDLGLLENVKLVFCNNLKPYDFYLWKMPYWKPVTTKA